MTNVYRYLHSEKQSFYKQSQWINHSSRLSKKRTDSGLSRRRKPSSWITVGNYCVLEFLHLGLNDISCRRTRSICTACFVVWRHRRAADTSTNRRKSFLCHRTASMEHAADTAEATLADVGFLEGVTLRTRASEGVWAYGKMKFERLWVRTRAVFTIQMTQL